MILVKKILGLVLTLFVVFSFVGATSANAQFGNICKCAWEFPVCGVPAPTGSISCRTADDDTTCPAGLTTIGNPVCDRDGDGDGNACFNVAGACGGGPGPTAVPTPTVAGYVQGRYRLQPGNVAISETYFGSDLNKLHIYLDRYLSGDDALRTTDITNSGTDNSSTSYTSRNVVTDFILNGQPAATWTVRSFVPSNVSVGYTVCYGNTNCHVVPTGQPVPNQGNRVTLNQNSMLNGGTTNPRYADVYWHYCRNVAPGGLRVSPELPCGQTGAQTVMWDGLNGTMSYQLRIDDGGTWTGDANGDGRCDFQGNPAGGADDWCVDNIPATVSPSYVIPNGLPAGKTYRIWVHAINQCGGGTTVSTQITYARTCGPTNTPAVSTSPAPVSCQNITVWKNGVRIYEPYSSIRLNDNISYVATVNSSRSISQIVYSVTKNGVGGRESVPAICPPALNNRNYTGTLTKRQDVYGTYNIRYHSVVYGNCVPNETN